MHLPICQKELANGIRKGEVEIVGKEKLKFVKERGCELICYAASRAEQARDAEVLRLLEVICSKMESAISTEAPKVPRFPAVFRRTLGAVSPAM